MTVGVIIAAVIAALVIRPTYEAVANIRIDPNEKSAIDFQAVANGSAPDQALVDSEVKIMESREVARDVVQTLHLTDDPEFNPTLKHGATAARTGASPVELTIDSLLRHLDVSREGATYIIALKFSSANPARAANLANAFANAYISASVQSKIQTAAQQSTWLTDRLNAAGAAARQADAALSQYRTNNGIVTSATGGTVTEQQISTLTSELATAESAAAAARSNYLAAQAQAAQAGVDSVSTVTNSATIVDLRRQRTELMRDRAEIDARYGPKHPEAIKIAQQVDGLDRQMHDESLRIIAGLESDARAAEARAESLRKSLAALRGQLDTNSRASVEADSLQRDADAKHTIFNQLAASAQQVNQQQHVSQAQAQIISLASVPTSPHFPNKSLFAALGAALGLIAGSAAVVVAEFTDAGVRTIEEVEGQLGINFIASAPLLTPRTLQQDGRLLAPWDYVIAKPMSGYAEAMRTTRSAIMLSDVDKRQKVVAVTSALPNEGKTVSSVSLARIMAMSGERVVLVDCDLRRNALEHLLTKAPEAGLIEVLAGEATLDSVIVQDSVKGLDILPLNHAAFTPRDLFGTRAMADLLDELRRRYDHVVLDGPPILAVTDARTLATMADAVLVVARWNATPRHAIQAAIGQLNRDGAKIAGMLLSMVDTRSRMAMSAGDPGYYYGHYKGYYQD